MNDYVPYRDIDPETNQQYGKQRRHGNGVVYDCRNCGCPEKAHLDTGERLQCLFAPGLTFNPLPPDSWFNDAE